MRNPRFIPIFLITLLFSWIASPVTAQERTPILPEDSTWSFVFAKPAAKNWTMQYPLPKGGTSVGQMHSDKNWPMEQPYLWMTTKLTLPADYKPGNLYLNYKHHKNIIVFINGTAMFQRVGHTNHAVDTKYIPNLLKPGDNFVAVYCENNRTEWQEAYVTLTTDDLPPLNAMSLYSADDKWSYTFDDPGPRWTTQFPLPRCKYAAGVFVSHQLWEDKRNIWLTRVMTLPANYKPEEMIVQYRCCNNIWIYVNGNEVLYREENYGQAQMVRDVQNFLKPGKNIIAVRGERLGGGAHLDLDMFIRKYTAEDKKNPLEGLPRPGVPDDAGNAAEGMMNQVVEEAKELTETEKKIQLGLNCLKLGQTELGISTLEKAAEADEKDFTANCILGMYALTKQDNAVKALTYFTKCVKANPKDPSVLNNYGIAAMENKKFTLALESWERLAKIDSTLPVLGQNVGCMMDLLNKKRIVLKEPEQLRLVELYMTTCANQNRDRDPTLGFMLLPMQEGVGHRLDCDSVFVQEFKRGKETITCQPFEVRKTYYGK